ncbi:MAG TPA: DUF4142 domain-containing protein [Flavisolibacter sp.]|nr:DUF4142 domain-containing protein [Flavisolibacter sp.]
MKRTILSALTVLTLLSACDKDEDDDNELNSTDRTFMTNVAMGNMAEVQAGQLAATKGTNPQVVQFGQHMVTEHTLAQTELRAMADSLGVALPTTVDAEHQALMVRLNGLSGYSFDTAYMNSQVRDHQKTLNIFQMEMNDGNHQRVRFYASKYMPHIQMHLQEAQSIRSSL